MGIIDTIFGLIKKANRLPQTKEEDKKEKTELVDEMFNLLETIREISPYNKYILFYQNESKDRIRMKNSIRDLKSSIVALKCEISDIQDEIEHDKRMMQGSGQQKNRPKIQQHGDNSERDRC